LDLLYLTMKRGNQHLPIGDTSPLICTKVLNRGFMCYSRNDMMGVETQGSGILELQRLLNLSLESECWLLLTLLIHFYLTLSSWPELRLDRAFYRTVTLSPGM